MEEEEEDHCTIHSLHRWQISAESIVYIGGRSFLEPQFALVGNLHLTHSLPRWDHVEISKSPCLSVRCHTVSAWIWSGPLFGTYWFSTYLLIQYLLIRYLLTDSILAYWLSLYLLIRCWFSTYWFNAYLLIQNFVLQLWHKGSMGILNWSLLLLQLLLLLLQLLLLLLLLLFVFWPRAAWQLPASTSNTSEDQRSTSLKDSQLTWLAFKY